MLTVLRTLVLQSRSRAICCGTTVFLRVILLISTLCVMVIYPQKGTNDNHVPIRGIAKTNKSSSVNLPPPAHRLFKGEGSIGYQEQRPISISQNENPATLPKNIAPVQVDPSTFPSQPLPFSLQVVPVDCIPWEFCPQKPGLEIRANGQFENSKIVKIQVLVGEQTKVFNGDDISIHLPSTKERGDLLTYWATTENGTQSPPATIKYINYTSNNNQAQYYFALLGPEWSDAAPSGSLLWEIFSPMGVEFPPVLEKPLTADYLYTTNRYSYLAGRLILRGIVDARSCSDGGVGINGYATACGEEKAATQVLQRQNHYDLQIYEAATRYNVPARILKAMIAQETQFWPDNRNPYEIGLGRITENGVEMLLAWNNRYFLNLCVAAYGNRGCSGGYFYLHKDYQAALRRAVWEKVSTNEEIDVLAAMLFASAAQVNQMVHNTMYTSPGDVASYEDMWKITVANYHSGSGCIGTGMLAVAGHRDIFTWNAVSNYLLGDCKQSLNYVDNVWRYAGSQR